MNNLKTVEIIVALQMEVIAHLWQRLQLLVPKHMPSYTLGESCVTRANEAASLALETYREESDRWTYVVWLGEYQSGLAKLVREETPEDYPSEVCCD